MLIDFLFASFLAMTGVVALSAVTTETLALNRDIAAYTVTRNALDDLAGRWQLEASPRPIAPVGDLCASPSEAWQASWCDDTARSAYRVLDDMQVCVIIDAGRPQARIAWDGVNCGSAEQPQVGRALP